MNRQQRSPFFAYLTCIGTCVDLSNDSRDHVTVRCAGRSTLYSLRPLALGLLLFSGPLISGCGVSTLSTTMVVLPQESKGSDPKRARSNAPSAAGKTVKAQGRLLPYRGIIKVSALPGDRVESILARPGSVVEKGQPIVKLRSEAMRTLEVESAEAKLEEARSGMESRLRELELAVSAAKSRLTAAEQAVEMARAQSELVELGDQQIAKLQNQIETLERLRLDPLTSPVVGRMELETKSIELEKLQAGSKQNRLASQNSIQLATSQREQAGKALEAAIATLESLQKSSPITALEKQLSLLRLQQSESTLVAPYAATILQIISEEGERVTAFPILELADLTRMVCMAEVYEADVSKIHVDDLVTMRSAALENVLQGKVIRIDKLVGASQMRSPNPMARTDFRSVAVWIEIAPEHVAEASQRVQLQVDVSISCSN